MPAVDGFLVSLPCGNQQRGWPNPERVADSMVWFHGYLAGPATVRGRLDATTHGMLSAGPELGVFLPAPSRRILLWAPTAVEDAVAREAGASAILTGEGGDESFWAVCCPGIWPTCCSPDGWPGSGAKRRGGPRSPLGSGSAGWPVLGCTAGAAARRWCSRRPSPLAASAPFLDRAYLHDAGLEDRAKTTTPMRMRSVHGQAVLDAVAGVPARNAGRRRAEGVGRGAAGNRCSGQVTRFHAAIQIEVWLRHRKHPGSPELLTGSAVAAAPN